MGYHGFQSLVQQLLELAVKSNRLLGHGQLHKGIPSCHRNRLHLHLASQIELGSQDRLHSHLGRILRRQAEILPDVLHMSLHRGVEQMWCEHECRDPAPLVFKEQGPVDIAGLDAVVDTEQQMRMEIHETHII